MTRLVLSRCFLQETYYCLSTNKKLLVSWQISGPYGITKYGSGWRKDVVNQCLEFGSECVQDVQFLPPVSGITRSGLGPAVQGRVRQVSEALHARGIFRHGPVRWTRRPPVLHPRWLFSRAWILGRLSLTQLLSDLLVLLSLSVCLSVCLRVRLE